MNVLTDEIQGAGVAGQFQDAQEQHEAATLGMWIFLTTEVMLFGGLCCGYTVYRLAYTDAFYEACRRYMEVPLGALNTAVLLTSSLTMALAVRAIRRNDRRAMVGFLLATMMLGTAFLAIKGVEYHHKYLEHAVPGWDFAYAGADRGPEQLFLLLYFLMTGLHALHLLAAICAVALMAGLARRFSAAYHTPVELAGLLWHFVDVVWIFLFPLFYLIRPY